MKKTEWFPANILPVHRGVYECERLEYSKYMVKRKLHWNGSEWSFHEPVREYGIPAGSRAAMFVHHGDRWRGLTEKA